MAMHENAPRGVLAFGLRAPAVLYRWRLGWVLGSRFLLLRHRGRRSGLMRANVLEVVARDREAAAWYVASGWGERSQWYRNIVAEPRVRVTAGRRTFDAAARVLPKDEGRRVLDDYRRRHRIAITGMQRVFGFASYEELVAATPVVEIREGAGASGGAQDVDRRAELADHLVDAP